MLTTIIIISKQSEMTFFKLKENLRKDSVVLQSITYCEYENQFKVYEQKQDKDTIMFLCDHAEIALKLQKNGYGVIVWLTAENRAQNFSKFTYAIEGIENLDYDYFLKVWQRFQHLPWQIGETSRCLIREMEENDIDQLYELYKAPEITKYMEDLYKDRDMELAYIKQYIDKIYCYYGFGTWLIIDKCTERVIGRVGFNYRPGFDEPELGFVIGVPYQKQGYAFEVCSYLLAFAKEAYEWDYVQALTKPHNEASIALLHKLGFSYQQDVNVDNQTYHRYLCKL